MLLGLPSGGHRACRAAPQEPYRRPILLRDRGAPEDWPQPLWPWCCIAADEALCILTSALQSPEFQLLLEPFRLSKRIQGQEGLALFPQQMGNRRTEGVDDRWLTLAANPAIGFLAGFAWGR